MSFLPCSSVRFIVSHPIVFSLLALTNTLLNAHVIIDLLYLQFRIKNVYYFYIIDDSTESFITAKIQKYTDKLLNFFSRMFMSLINLTFVHHNNARAPTKRYNSSTGTLIHLEIIHYISFFPPLSPPSLSLSFFLSFNYLLTLFHSFRISPPISQKFRYLRRVHSLITITPCNTCTV